MVGETIRQSDLRNNNAEILRRVASGESFTVTVHGRPVADVVPHQRVAKRQFVPATEIDALLATDSPGPDPALWMRDIDGFDEYAGDGLPTDPWERERGGQG